MGGWWVWEFKGNEVNYFVERKMYVDVRKLFFFFNWILMKVFLMDLCVVCFLVCKYWDCGKCICFGMFVKELFNEIIGMKNNRECI